MGVPGPMSILGVGGFLWSQVPYSGGRYVQGAGLYGGGICPLGMGMSGGLCY